MRFEKLRRICRACRNYGVVTEVFMENFGLLKLLSALAGTENSNKDETANSAQTAAPPEQNAANAGFFTADERARRAAEMLERHEAALRRIKKNPPRP